jgi:signal transduction histidine kinase
MSVPDTLGGSGLSAPRVERATRGALDAFARVPAPVAWCVVGLGLAVSWLIAHLVGGAGMVAPHWFYLPVLYAAARFGCLGAGASAVAAGLLAGPLTPSDIGAGIAQEPQDWIVRATFFVVIGQAMALVIGQSRSAMTAEVERLIELDRLKDTFVASVSHELRTPLTSIRGYLELVLEEEAGDDLTNEQRGFLAIAERNVERLLHVVEDLLFVAQVNDGKLAIERAPVDLAALAADCVEASRPFALEKGVALSLSAESGSGLWGDAARLGQVLDNLVSNALKFTPAGGRVEVRTSASEGRALLEVADTGSGIPPADLKRVFERFFRSASANEQAVQGTGLGLGITKAIIEAHGGTIVVESEEGVGTTFRVELPVAGRAEAETPFAPMEVARTRVESPSFSSQRGAQP